MLHLARKAFYPSPPPFPLLHVDTTWKFRAMYEFRDRMAAEAGMELLVHQNPECVERGHQPVRPRLGDAHRHVEDRGPEAGARPVRLRRAFGGARRDEEKSRAKERVFSIRSAQHRWDPKQQRPELWRLYNARTQPGRERPGVPAVELDRARRLAVHPPRGDPDRAAVLRGAAAGGRARRHADHGRRRPHAAARPARSPRCAASASARSAATR